MIFIHLVVKLTLYLTIFLCSNKENVWFIVLLDCFRSLFVITIALYASCVVSCFYISIKLAFCGMVCIATLMRLRLKFIHEVGIWDWDAERHNLMLIYCGIAYIWQVSRLWLRLCKYITRETLSIFGKILNIIVCTENSLSLWITSEFVTVEEWRMWNLFAL